MESARKDYYEILGVDEDVSRRDLDREYKRQAAKHHPDLGGSEENMKSLNEAYSVLRDETSRREYDRNRKRVSRTNFVPVSTPTARDVGVLGLGLNALLCLIAGLFLLLMVRFQGAWFLWPLAALAVFVLGFGVLMARAAMKAATSNLAETSLLRRRGSISEVAFWLLVAGFVFGLFLVLS